MALLLGICFVVLSFPGCDTGYGKVGGADTTVTVEDLLGIVGPWCGVWYSHYGKLTATALENGAN
jgi:hypothetical protein